ncbi:MAG: hypothetical protein ACJA08_001179 [Cyclobacteriaceae bacterium]|jgi:hypothetical protein
MSESDFKAVLSTFVLKFDAQIQIQKTTSLLNIINVIFIKKMSLTT